MDINKAALLTNSSVSASRADAAAEKKSDDAIRRSANEFEAVFVAEMLKHAGLEDAFGSEAGSYSYFLLNELSSKLAETSDLGFAEEVYAHLKRVDAEQAGE